MYPEDRVLVGVMPDPRDFDLARSQHWYRVPEKSAPKGIHAEYVAFYFTKKFDETLRWAVHFYARRTGHELVRRRDLLPDDVDHPRADQMYYKLQLGPMRQRTPPIPSLRWRRITFIDTTWDRFSAAEEINDLYTSGADGLFVTLKESGLYPEREYSVREGGVRYVVDLAIPCQTGTVAISTSERPAPPYALHNPDVDTVRRAVLRLGGPKPTPE